MRYQIRKILMIIKALIFIAALSITACFVVLSSGLPTEMQTFDMKSSIVISFGFGIAICLFINIRKKE